MLVLGDLAQDAAHDLAAAGFGQGRRQVDMVGDGDAADLGAHSGFQGGHQVWAGFHAEVERHIGINALALHVVRETDDGGFGHVWVCHQR